MSTARHEDDILSGASERCAERGADTPAPTMAMRMGCLLSLQAL